jgi:phosphoserine phosphatase
VNGKSASEIALAIEAAARRASGGAVAFDGDGTLWSGDIGEDYFDALLRRGLLEAAYRPLVREAEEHGLDPGGTVDDLAHRIHAAYLAGAFPEERVCEVIAWVAAGMSREELDAFSTDLLRAADLPGRLHAEAIFVLEHVRRLGVDVFIVSASPRAVVDAAARLVGVAPAQAISVRELVDGRGVVTAGVERPIPYGPGKVTRLREKLAHRPLYAAFGDNAFDVPLLCSAEIRVAVRPKARLLERAAEVPGLLVLGQT